VITSTSNPKIKFVRALQAKRIDRESENLFVVEGIRLVEEALQAAAKPDLVLYTPHPPPRVEAAVQELARRGAQVDVVDRKVMAAASDTQTPQGLLAVVSMALLPVPQNLSLALVIDGLADPGNMGTILRSASAAGVEAVFFGPGTVDPYNPKVVRAAMGAHFHLPLVYADWAGLAQRLAGLDLWLAEARAGTPYSSVDWRRPSALIIGSEAAGPSAPARRLAANQVHIPMPGPAESLNAATAAAVILFEAARQRSS
jgi:TrmH family RNA methyltransferase